MTDESKKLINGLVVNTSPEVSDFEAVIRYVNRNLKLGAFPRIATDSPISLDKATDWYQQWLAGTQVYAIAFYGDVVVAASHVDINHGNRKHCGVLAVTVDAEWWGRGIATELVERVRIGCLAIGVTHLRAAPTRDNKPMISVLRKLKFVEEARLREAFLTEDGQYIDLVQYLRISERTR